MTQLAQDQEEQRLIDHYVDLDVERYPGGRADARLRESGVSVWAIIGFLRVYANDLERVAEHYGLTRAEVEAALAYYRNNKQAVDARLVLNGADAFS